MRRTDDPASTARAIIAANLYMVLGTADERGQPWVWPVYYAPRGLSEFVWVSRPEALHSRNITARPEISIVIFDSSVPIGTGQGVYMAAVAEELTGEARRDAIETFSRRSTGHGGGERRRAPGRTARLLRDSEGPLRSRRDRPSHPGRRERPRVAGRVSGCMSAPLRRGARSWSADQTSRK